MKNICALFTLLILFVAPLSATNYYVSPSGKDSKNGLTESNAWATVDNGNKLGLLVPGDTVKILPGTYYMAATAELNTDGTAALPIVYSGSGNVLLDGNDEGNIILLIEGNHVIVQGLELTNSGDNAIHITSDSCTISENYIHDNVKFGIRVEGSYSLFQKNIIVNTNDDGIRDEGAGDYNLYYGNTIYGSVLDGIELKTDFSRLFNNIFVGNENGINGNDKNICAFNNVWNNGNADYAGGVSDSAGGLSVDPLFTNAISGDFSLESGSSLIDAGFDLGYDYCGMNPEIGAEEFIELFSLTLTPVYDSLIADSIYEFIVSGIDNCGEIIESGPVTWSHTFTTGTIYSNGLFIPNLVGAGTIIVTSDINGVADTSAEMTVVPGELDSLYITPNKDSISTDSTCLFTVAGFDSYGNSTAEIGIISWLVLNGIGTIDDTGLFWPTKASYGFIRASSSLGVSELTDSIFVIPGTINYIEVLPETDLIEDGITSQYIANSYDADSNFVQDISSISTWTTTDGTGSINATGLYTAGSVSGDYFVKAVYSGFADSGAVEVIASGTLDYIQIELENGTPFGDTTLTTDNDTTMLYCRGYNSLDALLGDFAATWSLVDGDSIGAINIGPSVSTQLTLTKPGIGKVVADRSGVSPDTTGTITCGLGAVAHFIISPDTATITIDSTLHFTAISIDADSNATSPQAVPTWSVLNGIGSITIGGSFTPTMIGTGQIVASGIGVDDTTGIITVNNGILREIVISPNTMNAGLGDSILFTAAGFDVLSNPVDVGELTWMVLGSAGSINDTGLFIATEPGVCSVMVTSSINGIYKISDSIIIEALLISEINPGNCTVYPGAENLLLKAFRIENFYFEDKTIISVSVRDASNGDGNQAERLSNLQTLNLFYDKNQNSVLDAADSLISSTATISPITSFSFSPVTIDNGSDRSFLVGGDLIDYSHDGDSLGFRLFSQADIVAGDGILLDGPNELSVSHKCVINGMISNQLGLINSDTDTISPGSIIHNIFTIDIPRNGYQSDTLSIFNWENLGTANNTDFDSLILLRDDGDNVWDGYNNEVRVGKLLYTGDRWSVSGLNASLDLVLNRFYVSAAISEYASDQVTIVPVIPRNSLEMKSENDGPIDAPTSPIDTIVIQNAEDVTIEIVNLYSKNIFPGLSTGPLLNLKFSHSYPDPLHLDSLNVVLFANDPDGASQTDLDSQVDSISIYLKRDHDYQIIGANDSLLSTASISDGSGMLIFENLLLPVNGELLELTATVWLNDNNCKNGNLINLGFASGGDLFFAEIVEYDAVFPVKNAADYIIDAFQSSQVSVVTVDEGTFFGGQNNRLAVDFTLPPNGYSEDELYKIKIVNNGSLNIADNILTAKLWVDVGDDGFTVDDSLLGEFSSKSDFWEISDLSYTVADGGARFLVTCDIAGTQFEAGTIQLAIPVDGVEYLSGMTGPDDDIVENLIETLVFPSNRITVISIPIASSPVRPESQNKSVLTFALYNGYVDQSQTLSGLKLTNKSHTIADLSYSDYEFGQLSLYFDDDKNRLFDDDSLVAAGYFTDGQLSMSGLNLTLPAESLSYFFVVADLPKELIDSDSLALAVDGPSDLTFLQSVNINGDLPLVSGGFLIADGSVKNQYEIINVPPQTLSPGDTSITFFTFKPAYNGNQIDTLNSITIRNLEDADNNDISQLTLWFDKNGDNLWQETDSLFGSFGYQSGNWTINSLGLEVGSTIPSLFVLGDIAASATPNVSFQAELPLNGCLYVSGNDGPIDTVLVGTGVFIISSSGIKIVPSQLDDTYSVGQSIHVEINATNISAIPIDSLVAEVVNVDNPALVTLDSSFYQMTNLNVGESTSLSFYYTADQPGDISWQLRAVAPNLPDSSAVIQTNSITIQSPPTEFAVQMINSIPTAVTRGQANIFPFSLKFEHPDLSSDFAAIEMNQIRVRIENSSGIGLPADEIFSRVVLSSGYSNLSIMETIPADSNLTFTFSQPLVIMPGEEQFISILVDIDSLAIADDFVLSIENSSSISPVDANTDLTVPLASSIIFPLKTSSCNIDNHSNSMVISYANVLNSYANYGQDNVNVLRLRLRHPGEAGSSQIQLTDMSLSLTDAMGDSIVAVDLFENVRLVRQGFIIAENSNLESGTAQIDLQLNSPMTLGSQEVDTVFVQVSIKESSASSNFRLVIADSTAFTVRDLSSGSILDIITDTAFTLSTATIFPIQSGSASLKHSAVEPEFCMIDILPSTIAAGRDSLDLFGFSLNYDVGSEYSSVKINRIYMSIQDSLGNVLNADKLFDEVGHRISGTPVVYQSSAFAYGNDVMFTFGESGLILNPGDSLSVELIADIETNVLYDNFKCVVIAENSFELQDATDTSQYLGLDIEPECNSSFPFVSFTSRIFLPADQPTLMIQTIPTQLAYPGQTGLPIFQGEIRYESIFPLGDLILSGLAGQIYKHTTGGLMLADSNEIFSDIYIKINGQTKSSDLDISSDSVTVSLATGYDIVRGYNTEITLLCDIQDQVALGNYLIQFSDSTFLSLLDKNLATTISPKLAGGTYPLNSAEISLTAASLESSFTNYPNPFNPGIGEYTTIGYVLPEDAFIDIELFTITGEEVRQVADNSFRLAGSQQQDVWRGHNDNGFAVQPGTYYCRITARYVTGGSEVFRRKVSIVR